MSAVGFDVGNENLVVAAARHGGIDVLLNGESSRETPAFVSFGDNQRSLGGAAASSAAMHPRATLSQIKRLLGRSFRDPFVQEDLRRFPFPVKESSSGGIVIPVRYLNQEREFSPVQILAMLLSHLKDIAEKSLKEQVINCVIGIPAYATEVQRRAYLDAAQIAGLRPLRLIHDVTATALGYGVYRMEPQFASSGAHGSESIVIFVDVGHCDTQVAVVEFERGHMRVLSHAFDANLGGRDFDEVLFRYFSDQFKEQYKIDVNGNVRAGIRLRAACEKLKKVLSANAEAPLNIECLMEEKDVKGFIKREEFERLSADLLERILVPCQKVLADTGVSHDSIFSIELVGSGSRIPAVSRKLSSLFGRELSRTLNASECVARGCALQCAMLSPTFRVRDYEVEDSFPFSIGFSSDEGPICMPTQNIFFRRGQPIPSVKLLTFRRNKTFHLEAFYADQSELSSGVPEKISNFMIELSQDSNHNKQRVKVRIQLDLHGIITVQSAYVIEDDEDDPVSSSSAMRNAESEFLSHASDSQSSAMEEDFSLHESGPQSQADGRKKQRPRRHEVSVAETVHGGLTRAELSEAQAQECELADHDRMVERTKDKKNAVEAYVYENRNKLFGEYRSFASEAEREEISASLTQTEEWLYDEGDNESEDVYADKITELKKLVGPVERRMREEEARARQVRELLNCIVDYRMGVENLEGGKREAVVQACNAAEQWLREKTQLQEMLPRNVDPVLWSSDIKDRIEALHASCEQIMNWTESSGGTESR